MPVWAGYAGKPSYLQQVNHFLETNYSQNITNNQEFFDYIRNSINDPGIEMLSANAEQEGVAILDAIHDYLHDRFNILVAINIEIYVSDKDGNVAAVDNITGIQDRMQPGNMTLPLRIIQVGYNHYEPVYLTSELGMQSWRP